MSLIVQKFGGSSVRDYAHLLRMARIVKSRVDEGDDVVVVLSAQGDTTDGLLQKAKEISERPSLRELDMLLSAGEQMSAALGAMTLRSIGVEAVSLCAWQIPIETDGTHGNAEIELIDTARIRKELAEGHVVVAAGFQGVDENGDVTTLGRGGSDTSAVALAAALKADELIIYTDVDGIFSSDPRICQNAVRREVISYDDMLLLAQKGAGVLHERGVALARAGGHVSIITDSPVIPQQYLPLCAGLAIRSGMDPYAALRAITICPAEHIGVADRVGSIEVGKDADLVLCRGNVMDVESEIQCVLIEGCAVPGLPLCPRGGEKT